MKRLNHYIYSHITLCLLFSFNVLNTAAQTSIDSVKQSIAAYQKEDTVKVELLIDACVNATFSADDITLTWATEAKRIAEELAYKKGQIRAINCIGNYYYQRGAYDKATDYYLQALRISEEHEDEENILISKSNLANVFTHMKKQREAIVLYKECDAFLINKGDTLSQKRAAILTNLATAYSAANQHDSAVYQYLRVYDLCKKLNIGFGLGLTLSNLSSEYYQLQQYEKALTTLHQAQSLAVQYKLDFLMANINKIYGRTYLAMKDPRQGIIYLERAVEIAKVNKDLSVLTETYNFLQEAYTQVDDFKHAHSSALLYLQMKDSLYGIEKSKVVSELETKYEADKKEIAIAQLEQQNMIAQLQSQRKDALLFAICGLSFFLLITGYTLFSRYKTKQQNKTLNDTLEYEQNLNKSILTSIKAQMNPHFFYNALNTIQSFIFSDDKRNATTYLSKFSTLTRMILEMSEKERISLSQEIKALTLYLEIEKARFNEDFIFSLEIDGAVDVEMISIPSMLIQPYVENAIKHGLLHKTGLKTVNISLKHEDEALTVGVHDNGIGRIRSQQMNSLRSDRHESFSTKANQTRLELLNKGRGKKIGVQYIDSSDNHIGTTVIITIPLV